MDDDAYEKEKEVNRCAYVRLRNHIQKDCAGQYVAIAFGRIVAVSPDFHQAVATTEALQPKPLHCAVFLAENDPSFDEYEAWHVTYE